MKRRQSPGFTIIEVVLFLAISGLMVVGLLVGTSAAMRGQQYKDAVQSYANFLRDQYSRVITVENSRAGDDVCPLSSSADASPKGRSDCVIVGRYVSTSDGSGAGEVYEARAIYAIRDEAAGGSGVPTYRYQLAGNADKTYETNWGAKTRLSSYDSPRAMGLVMWRDPVHGLLRIAVSSDLEALHSEDGVGAFIANNLRLSTASQEICIDGASFIAGQKRSVTIDASAGSGDAVRVGNASEECR